MVRFQREHGLGGESCTTFLDLSKSPRTSRPRSNLAAESVSTKHHDPALLTTSASAAIASLAWKASRSNDPGDENETRPRRCACTPQIRRKEPSSGRTASGENAICGKTSTSRHERILTCGAGILKSVIEKGRIPMPALLKQTTLRALISVTKASEMTS